jgi:excisionase family DNA binding protein
MRSGSNSEGKIEPRLLTVQEAARFLTVSASTLYGWVWQRKIPFVKVGRALRFDLTDLEEFIEASRTPSRNSKRSSSSEAKPCYNTSAAGKG